MISHIFRGLPRKGEKEMNVKKENELDKEIKTNNEQVQTYKDKIAELESENTRLKAMLFDYMFKDKVS